MKKIIVLLTSLFFSLSVFACYDVIDAKMVDKLWVKGMDVNHRINFLNPADGKQLQLKLKNVKSEKGEEIKGEIFTFTQKNELLMVADKIDPSMGTNLTLIFSDGNKEWPVLITIDPTKTVTRTKTRGGCGGPITITTAP